MADYREIVFYILYQIGNDLWELIIYKIDLKARSS